MKHFVLFLLTLLVWGGAARAQMPETPATQRVRGTVTDAVSHAPLPGASVVVVSSEPFIGTATDAQGRFTLGNVPLGRQAVRVSLLGFQEQLISSVIVTAGKEVVLGVELEEQAYQLSGAEVVYERDKAATNNEMTSVSARAFNVEETSRFAGSRNDPARMATNFAGVSGANDARNDIIIRGNSPAGLLWRLEGINIPNPSHFGALGSTGGPVSMLNNNVLDKSDFLTAAFPAQYGNAVAGVFDLQLRQGNNQRHEFLGQVGFNGFELGAEGPLGAPNGASYLVNYRYSTLGVFQALGINFGTGSATPQYQDLSFKVAVPTKRGKFTVFGLGGLSRINLLGSEEDTTKTNLYGSDSEDSRLKYQAGVLGASYQHQLSERTFARLTVAASNTREEQRTDSLSRLDRHPVPLISSDYRVNKYSANLQLNHKISARDNVAAGAVLDLYDFRLVRQRLVAGGSATARRNAAGQPLLAQAYAQWQHKFSNRLTLNTGLNSSAFSESRRATLEPRAGLKYQLTERQTLALGYGLHSQLQPLQVYYTQTQLPDGRVLETNQRLDFTRSQHFVLGYDRLFGPDWHLKAEAYYQRLARAAVEQRPSSFSMLNAGADFQIPANDSLVSRGTGRNYGLELTVEKFYRRGYYVLATASLFDSKYRGSDEVLRNTAFNGRYVVNLLTGKEFQLGRTAGRSTFNVDWKVTAAGGRYTTPIDEARSRAAADVVYVNDQAFTRQLKDYFRTDLKLSVRRNGRRVTQEFSLDLQNLLNTRNVFLERYNPLTGQRSVEHQIGFFPIPQYRILF